MTDYSGTVINLLTKSQYESATISDNELYAIKSEVIVETWSSGSSWYRKYSDGWVEQGGRIRSSSSSGTVTLLEPFSDTNYFCIVEEITTSSGGSYCYESRVRNFTTTSFDYYINYTSSSVDNGVWYACGQGSTTSTSTNTSDDDDDDSSSSSETQTVCAYSFDADESYLTYSYWSSGTGYESESGSSYDIADIYWNGNRIVTANSSFTSNTVTYTSGGYTYTRGTLVYTNENNGAGGSTRYYRVCRTPVSS